MRKRITKSVNKFTTKEEAKKFFDSFVDAKTGLPKCECGIRYIHVEMTYTRPNGPESDIVYSVEVWSK